MIRNSRKKREVSIDMTSLMDLTFMLLIVFIVTVPVMDYSTDVTPPSMNTPNEMERDNDSIIRVSLDSEGRYKVNDIVVAPAELEGQLAGLQKMGCQSLTLRADRARPYEEIIAVMRAGNHLGLKVALMTSQE